MNEDASEYERKGGYAVENPGSMRTLRMGDGAQAVYAVNGSIKFLFDNDWLRNALDVFSFVDVYASHC